MGQPPPTKNNMPATWDLVIEDLQKMSNDPMNRDIYIALLDVMDDAKERNEIGMTRYGTPLQPFNGRDSGRDAYDEAMDLCVYCKNKSIEMGENDTEYFWDNMYIHALHFMIDIRRELK